MKKILKSIKEYYADMGILGGTICGLFAILVCVVFSPFILIAFLNELSKSWFGGDFDA